MLNNISSYFVMKVAENLCRDRDYYRKELPRGSLQVYRALVSSVFPTSSAAEDEGNSNSISNNFLISEVLEDRLSRFYAESLKQIEENNFKLHYQLLDLSDLMFVRAEILIGAKRNAPADVAEALHLVAKWDFLPVFVPHLDASTEGDGDNVARVSLGALNAMTKMRKFVTLRVWVEVKANEIFAVRDAAGAVVQGSVEPKENVHEMLLEVLFE